MSRLYPDRYRICAYLDVIWQPHFMFDAGDQQSDPTREVQDLAMLTQGQALASEGADSA